MKRRRRQRGRGFVGNLWKKARGFLSKTKLISKIAPMLLASSNPIGAVAAGAVLPELGLGRRRRTVRVGRGRRTGRGLSSSGSGVRSAGGALRLAGAGKKKRPSRLGITY